MVVISPYLVTGEKGAHDRVSWVTEQGVDSPGYHYWKCSEGRILAANVGTW
jgi:hypothetical protein